MDSRQPYPTALLATAYFAPVQWYQKLLRYDRCLIEQHDHFVKQTYRNRCVIATTQGPQTLTVPVEHGEGQKCEMKDVRISDHGNWRHLHWNALLSAYGESPFFEYLADDIRPFFERKWEWLYDFNWEITEKLCGLLDIAPHLERTDHYMTDEEIAAHNHQSQCQPEIRRIDDFRETIRPKHPLPDSDFQPQRYYQVFERKHGFLPNLSVLDLLFNMGNEAVLYLCGKD